MLMKRISLIFILIIFIPIIGLAAGSSSFDQNQVTVLCSIGVPDDLTIPQTYWTFQISKNSKPALENLTYILEVKYSVTEWVNVGDTTKALNGNILVSGSSIEEVMNNFFKDKKYYNFVNNVDGALTDNQLKNIIANGKCPKYMYMADNKSANKYGFLFSNSQLDAATVFSNAGYNVQFKSSGKSLDNAYKKYYEEHLELMKKNIKKHEDENWANVCDEDCFTMSYFGMFGTNENFVVNKYETYKSELKKSMPSYDFTEGDKLLSVYKNKKCACYGIEKVYEPHVDDDFKTAEQNCKSLLGDPKDSKTPAHYLMVAFNIIKYISILLTIGFSIMDFIQATTSHEEDQLKKAMQNSIKRLVLCIVLFVLPILIEFVLQFLNDRAVNLCIKK